MKPVVQQKLDGISALLDAAYEYGERVDNYSATSLPDEPVQVSINGQGRLTHCEMRPGLQRDLTAADLSEAFTAAISGISRIAEQEQLEMLDEFRIKSQAVAAQFEHDAHYGAALADLGGIGRPEPTR